MSIDEALGKLEEIGKMTSGTGICVRKGDIYYVSKNQYTAEHNLGMYNAKPMVIISCDEINDRAQRTDGYVLAVNLSSKVDEENATTVRMHSSGRECMCLCERVYTIPVARLGKLIGGLTYEEMDAVDEALRYAMGLSNTQTQEHMIGEKVVEIFRMAVGRR